MGNRIVLLILASLMLVSFPTTYYSLPENYENNTSNIAIIEVNDGYYQSFNDSGFVEITMLTMPSNISNINYTMYDNNIARYSGDLQINSSDLNYQIPVHHHIITPCICVLSIQINSEDNSYGNYRVLIDSHELNNQNNHMPDWMIIPTVEINRIDTELLLVKNSVSHPGSVQNIQIKSSIISESNNQQYCVNGLLISDYIDTENLTSVESNYSTSLLNHGQLTIDFDVSIFDDGWISILYQIGDGQIWSESVGCIHTKLDLQAPIISIDTPAEIEERIGLLIIDASSSYDPKWGRNNLQYIWSYQNLNDPYSTPVSVIGDDDGVFTFDASKSGNYQFNLTLIDSASHVTSQTINVEIKNIRPDANIRIESVPVNDGDIIRLTNQQSWIVDAKYTTDTQNDIDQLSYTWFLDGNPIMSGKDRILTRPTNDNVMHELTLMVEDDDGAVDWVTVTIGIAGTPSDPSETSIGTKIIAGISVLVLAITIVAFFTITVKSNKTPDIRRWQTNTTEEYTGSRTED